MNISIFVLLFSHHVDDFDALSLSLRATSLRESAKDLSACKLPATQVRWAAVDLLNINHFNHNQQSTSIINNLNYNLNLNLLLATLVKCRQHYCQDNWSTP